MKKKLRFSALLFIQNPHSAVDVDIDASALDWISSNCSQWRSNRDDFDPDLLDIFLEEADELLVEVLSMDSKNSLLPWQYIN